MTANPRDIATITDLLKQGGCDEALTELRKLNRAKHKPWQAAAIAASEQLATLLAKNPVLAESVELFLLYVSAGCQAQAEAMLKVNSRLAETKGTLTDLSGRSFKEGISGFQYAVWALDWHMWKMIHNRENPEQGYLSAEQAAKQMAEFDSAKWIKRHGLNFSFNPLINSLNTCVKHYESRRWAEGNMALRQQVGSAQLWLPAHAIHEYCRPDRPFDPTPNFLEESLPRTMKTEEGFWFTAKYHGGRLGIKTGLLRAWRPCAPAAYGPGAVADHRAVCALSKTRHLQLKELKSHLLAQNFYRLRVGR